MSESVPPSLWKSEVESRLRKVERYVDAHEPKIEDRWERQHSHSDDHEKRLRLLEQIANRTWGAMLALSLVGSAIGSSVMLMIFKAAGGMK